ncbi:hypothetical protein ONS96_014197 [Cadophora gregata f. sp. sojae]|nr:hypothetical protein ONS96_014197 [Cadophora gregata f. sp. sojae]
MASYTPLDTSKNEVRMLTIAGVSGAPEASLVHCRLETVSLDDFTTEFNEFLDTTEHRNCTPDILKSWMEHARTTKLDEYPTAAPLELPYWRYTLHYSMDGSALSKWNQLMKGIDIDFEQCLEIPEAFYSSAPSNYPTPQPLPSQNDTKFSFLPRFNWGDYQAISYCWESETKDRQIVLNGSVIEVPRNLEAMLQRLRTLPDAHSGIKFWIDALCIDQTNIPEKGYQVRLMQTIYTRAFSLVVWLGSGSRESDRAIEFIASIAHHTLLEDQYGQEKYGCHFAKWARKHKMGMPMQLPYMPWRELLAFLSRNYWHRLWIIQELALNHNMTLFLCGEKSLSRSMVLRASQFCMRHAETIDQITPSSVKTVPDSSSYTYGSIWSTIYRVYCLVTLPDGETDEIQMDDVLDLGRKANVKEAVDKVYGILGLLPSKLSIPISPDYTLAPQQVYLNFAKAILGAFPNLDALFSWCSYSSDSGLPSWVPDWSTQYSRNHLYWLKICNASGSKPAQWCVSEHTRSLHCTGFVFDTVECMSGSLSESSSTTWNGHPTSFGPLPESVVCQYHTKGDLTAALRKTLVQNLTYSEDELYTRTTLDICWVPADLAGGQAGDIEMIADKLRSVISSPCWLPFRRFREVNANFPIFGFSFRDFFPILQQHRERMENEGGGPLNKYEYLPRVNQDEPRELDGNDALVIKRTTLTLQGRRLITTRNGYLGTAPEAALRGDVLAIIYGCSYPVVLRPSGDSYLLIGESYIDGVMDGELVEARESGMFEEVEFRIC